MDIHQSSTTFYLDTPLSQLIDEGHIDKTVVRSCLAAKPPMETAGDILLHLQKHGSFSDVPGCRRPGRIPDTLVRIAENTLDSNTPSDRKPVAQKRLQAGKLDEEANFEFLTEKEREYALKFRSEYGHLPMFAVLKQYLNRPEASRNDIVMAYSLGMHEEESPKTAISLADIASRVNLSRERVRQIAITYILPDILMHPRLWGGYADHSTYYADHNHPAYIRVCANEIPDLSFAAYASILHRTTMLQNVHDRFLARRGWVKEITAWVNRLSRLANMPRTIESRISLDGLAMGGTLDTRINLVVLHQIAPSFGITPLPPDALILPKNME